MEEISTFLEAEAAKLRKEIARLESKITAFKQKYMNELPETLKVNMQSLNNIEHSIEMAKQQIRSLWERREYLQAQQTSMDMRIEETLEDTSRMRLEDLQYQLSVLTKQFTDEYPDVKKVRNEIAELEEKLKHEAARGKSSVTRSSRFSHRPCFLPASRTVCLISILSARAKWNLGSGTPDVRHPLRFVTICA